MRNFFNMSSLNIVSIDIHLIVLVSENFLIGAKASDRHNIYLVDFGLVRQFKIGGKIRPERQVAAFRGKTISTTCSANKEYKCFRNPFLFIP